MNINLRNFALIPVLFALSACMQPARLTGDDSREHTKHGALIGTMMGAAVGLVSADTSDERPGKVVKAAIIGAGLGHWRALCWIDKRQIYAVIWTIVTCKLSTQETV